MNLILISKKNLIRIRKAKVRGIQMKSDHYIVREISKGSEKNVNS